MARRTDPRASVREANKEIKAPLRAIQAIERLMIDGEERTDQDIIKKCPEFSQDDLVKARLLLIEVGIIMQTGMKGDALMWSLNDHRREELEAERFSNGHGEEQAEQQQTESPSSKSRRPRKKALKAAIEEILMALEKVAHMRGKPFSEDVEKTMAWLENFTKE